MLLLLLVVAYVGYRLWGNLSGVMAKRGLPVLHSLKISHFVEKSRWALDLTHEEYRESFSYAVVGVVLKGRTLPALQLDARTTLGDSEDIATYLRGKHPDSFLAQPVDEALYARLDAFGAHVRRFLYGHLLRDSPDVVRRLWSTGKPWDVALFPIAKFLLVRLLRINSKGIDISRAKMDDALASIDALLADGRTYLNGVALSKLDIAFCSLAAPLVFEPLYGGGKLPSSPQELGKGSREALTPYQERPFAKYVHAIYQKHR